MGAQRGWMWVRGAAVVAAAFVAGVAFVVACGEGSDAGAQDGGGPGAGAGPGGGPGADPGGGRGGVEDGRFPGPCTVRDRLLVDQAGAADGYAGAEAVIAYTYDARGRVVRVETDGLIGEPHYHAADGYLNNIPSPMRDSDGIPDQVDEWEYDAAGNPTRMRRSLWMLRGEDGRYHLKTVSLTTEGMPFNASTQMVPILERTFSYAGCWP